MWPLVVIEVSFQESLGLGESRHVEVGHLGAWAALLVLGLGSRELGVARAAAHSGGGLGHHLVAVAAAVSGRRLRLRLWRGRGIGGGGARRRRRWGVAAEGRAARSGGCGASWRCHLGGGGEGVGD